MGGLLGALVNDFNLIKTKGAVFCIIVAVGTVIAYFITGHSGVHLGAMFAVMFLLPVFTLNAANVAFDSKWNQQERLWSVPPWAMIASRYLIYVLLTVVLAALWYVSPLYDGDWSNILMVALIAVTTGALYNPIMYALYSDHNIGFVILLFAALGAFMLVFFLGEQVYQRMDSGYGVVTVGAIAVLYVVSWVVSVLFYSFHMKRGV